MTKNSLALALAAFTGLAIGVRSAQAQLVIGNDAASNSLRVIDLGPGGTGSRVLYSGTEAQIYGLAADNENNTLYWVDGGTTLYKATMSPSGTLTPVLVGTMTVGGSSITTVYSLAYDSTADTLYCYRNSGGAGLEGFYSVDTATAACTLVHAVPATGFECGGFDYNPADDSFYVSNDAAGAPFASASVYRFPKPIDSATAVLVTAYPSGDSDIDGLAVGNGRLYLVNDNNSPPTGGGHYVYNLGTSSYEANIVATWSTTGANSGGTWAPGLVAPPTGADVAIAVVDSPDPLVVPPGGNITYTVTVTNNGPDPATGVSVTDVLPANTTFVSVQSPGVHNAGVVTANIGALASAQQSSFQIVVTPNGLGSYSNIAAVSSSSSDPISANNSATTTTTVRSPLADVSAAITPPADCSVPAGGTASYTFAINNAGPESAESTQLVVTFPANVSFVSSTPPVTPVGNTLTLATGTVSGGGNATLNASFTVNSGTTVQMSASVSTSTSDPSAGNNTTNNTLNIPQDAPTSAAITGILSTIASSPTSDVPGGGGFKFSATGGLERPFRSPDGTKWIMTADTDNPTTGQDEVILVGTVGGTFSAVVQEGITQLEEADHVGIIDEVMGINDSGRFVFATNTDNAQTGFDEVIVRWNGVSFDTVAREGFDCPALAGTQYGATSDSATIQNDGTITFYTSLLNSGGTTNDTAWVRVSGATGSVLVQEGVTIPTNQANGTTYTAEVLSIGTTEGQGIFLSADGTSSCGMHELITAVTAEDKVLVVNNDVKIQEGFVVPGSGFPSPVASASPLANWMESDGTWFAYGSNVDGQDWVVRNGTVVASTGAELTPGSGLTWGDASFTQTFFHAAGNTNGDYLVGGVFNGPSLLNNAALVLNGTTIIARENDPVDLDANGQFDDGYYIRTFIDDRVFLTNDAVYCVVRLRNSASALCAGTDTDQGMAFIRIPLPAGGCTVSCDYNDDGGGDNADITDLAGAIASDTDPYPNHCKDFNQDGGADNADVTDLANAIAGGTCP